MTEATPQPKSKPISVWSPLRRPIFRESGDCVHHLGYRELDAGYGGHLADDDADRLAASIALMQTAASLPVLLLGMPAGALADILDRRRLLLFWLTWMVAAAAILGLLTTTGWIGVGRCCS